MFTWSGFAQEELVSWWRFDEGKGRNVQDNASKVTDKIVGNYWYAEGVRGSCLKLDGYTTHVARSADKAPRLEGDFTIEAWVAPQTYPWNWTAIVNQEKDHKEGFFFGVGADGSVAMGVAIKDGQWRMCVSKEKIELLKWSHIAATFEKKGSISVYINGKKSGGLSFRESREGRIKNMKIPEDIEMWIGLSHTKMYAVGTEREPSKQLLSNMIFDGLIDEVKIYNGAMDEKEIHSAYEKVKLKDPQPLRFRRFPTEGKGKNSFGAYCTTMKYDPTWDALWRIGNNADIVVTFDKPVRIMFWHGTSYGASYVTENDIWMGDQSLESHPGWPNPDYRKGQWGCAEHMSDKQCRYSHVSLIENNPARVIVHWRYNPCYITYEQANVDSLTGQGDWVDEYFVIYPDAVTVRHQILWTSNWGEALDTKNWPPEGMPWHQFQETIMFNQPGTRPEDNVEMGAFTVANMAGQSHTYSVGEYSEQDKNEIEKSGELKSANIQMTNLKSQYKPFIIFEPGSSIDPWPIKKFYSWNHWPVAQLPSDGRVAQAADRPSHTSFSCGAPVIHNGENGSHMSVMLYGLKKGTIEELVPLARSWIYPAELKVIDGDIICKGYDKFQRAYVVECKNGGSRIELQIAGSGKSPVVNPGIVLKNWGDKKVSVKLNGVELEIMKDFRVGYEKKLEGIDLVLWVKIKSTDNFSVSIIPQD
jgi:hypothetical protein